MKIETNVVVKNILNVNCCQAFVSIPNTDTNSGHLFATLESKYDFYLYSKAIVLG